MSTTWLGPALFALCLTSLLLVLDARYGGSAERSDEALRAAQCLDQGRGARARNEEEAAEYLERWAPAFVQHVATGARGRDRPTRVDFDGDWVASNNWENQARFGAELPPAVYGAAVLTETHAYLTYTLYYPRDWADPLCLPYICHDNDLENVRLVVERNGGLVFIETKAHLDYYTLRGDEVAVDAEGRPRVAVEAKGHGPRPCRRGDSACAPGSDRLVYTRSEASSSRPRENERRAIRYELVSLRDSLWPRRHFDGSGQRLWTSGESGPLYYRGERFGRRGAPMGAALAFKRFPGGVRPPWALEGPEGARGDWFFDPAAAAAPRHPRIAESGRGAFDYVFHPYLHDLARECTGERCAHPVPPPEPSRQGAWAGMGAMAGFLMLALQRSRTRLWRVSRHRRRGESRRDRPDGPRRDGWAET